MGRRTLPALALVFMLSVVQACTSGGTSGTATFTVTNDSLDEADETVILTMSAATNATITDATAIAAIAL